VSGAEALGRLFAELPDDLRLRALTHSSWADERAESYGRLAFLGDSVLGLAIAEELYRRFPESDIGRLTKVHGQAVSGRACAGVAELLGLPAALREAVPEENEGIAVEDLLASERALASVCEAVIGASYLAHGFERTAAATVEAFDAEIELASETLLDFKSALQEELARSGSTVSYAVVREAGPPHDRRFEVEAAVGGEVLGNGRGRSKKAAEQAAAQQALDRIAAK
jgi:ribonuclease III